MKFDLAKAKAGHPVETVLGRAVRLLCFDRKNSDEDFPRPPIIGLVEEEEGTEVTTSWSEDGINRSDASRNLRMALKKTRLYCNYYPTIGKMWAYPTKETRDNVYTIVDRKPMKITIEITENEDGTCSVSSVS